MHYRERQIHINGQMAAWNGFGPEVNPYKPKTNFHRYWAAGHASVKQSATPFGHTYHIGDHVRPRGLDHTGIGKVSKIVVDIIDVPPEQITFNPNIDPGENDTGVGHHQWLVLEGKGNPISGCLVELDPDRTIQLPYSFVRDSGEIVSVDTNSVQAIAGIDLQNPGTSEAIEDVFDISEMESQKLTPEFHQAVEDALERVSPLGEDRYGPDDPNPNNSDGLSDNQLRDRMAAEYHEGRDI